MDVRTDAKIRDGATARLRYTTPLGELFIDITNPAQGTPMAEGDTLGLPTTETAPTVEDALSEASLLINGGGLDQLRIITDELNKALDRARTFLTEANATTQSIDAVLTSLNSLSKTLNGRKDTINKAMRQIRPAAAVLRRATPGFTKLLQAVQRFSGAANSTVNATRTQLLNLLAEVEPTLAELAANRGRFDSMLRSIELAANVGKQAIPTEYLNINGTLHLDGITGAGPVGGLLDLLDVIGVVLPTDQVNQLLDDLGLGGLLPKTTDPATSSDPATSDGSGGSGGSGGGTGIDNLIGLDGLLGGLTGGGA
jgi:phospholipid/cholesterol/gamma-HCH transport system substrate-binding protein